MAVGHTHVLLDILKINSCDVVGYLDVEPHVGITYLGHDESIGEYPPPRENIEIVNGVGSVKLPRKRQKIFEKFKAERYTFHSVIHPSVIISSQVQLGEGVQIMPGAVINVGAKIEDNVIVNTKASVDHECVIGGHSHIAPGVTVSGGVTIGTCSHIGTGANIIQNVTIGNNVLVGAGVTVKKDVPDEEIVK